MPPNGYVSTYQGDFGRKYGRTLGARGRAGGVTGSYAKYSAPPPLVNSLYPASGGPNKFTHADWSSSNISQYNR